MAVAAEEIYSLLVPLELERLLVPRSCVAEVIRYAEPTPDEGADSDSWLKGFVTWNNLRVPIVSIETLCGMPVPVPGGRSRIVVVHPVNGTDVGPYGILAEGFPQMVRISREIVKKSLAIAPRSIPMKAGAQSRDLLLELGRLTLLPGAGAPHATDLKRGRRPATPHPRKRG